MASNAKINILLDFTTSGSLSNIKKELESVSSSLSVNKLLSKGFTGEGANELKSQFSKFSTELTNSFNENTGKFNFKQLQKGLQAAGINISDLERQLNKAGISGKQSFENIQRGMFGFNTELKQSETLMQKLMFTFSNTARWRVSNAALNAFTNGIRDAYYFAKDLDRALTDISIVSGRTNEEMLAFADKANVAAKELKTTTLAYTQASLVFYQQGLAADAVQKMTEATIIGANIAGESTETMSELLTSTMNGYRLTAEEAMTVTDKLAAVGAASAADFYELSTAMSKVSSIGYTAGVTLDQLNAQIATIVSVTKGAPETVGHALKTIYTRMLAFRNESKGLMIDEEGESFGVPAVESALKRYNEMAGTKISLFEIDKNGEKQLRDSGEVIEEIGNSWDRTTDKAAKFGLATALAGSRQQNNLIALFNAWDMYGEQLEISLESEGTALEQNAIYMESYEGHVKSMKAEIESLYMTIADVDFLKDATDAIGSLVNGLDGFINLIGGFPTILGAIGGLFLSAFALEPIKKMQNAVSILSGKAQKSIIEETEAEKELAKIKKVYGEERVALLEQSFDSERKNKELRDVEINDLENKIRLLKDIEDLQLKERVRGSDEGTDLYDTGMLIKDAVKDEEIASPDLRKQLKIFQNEYSKALTSVGGKFKDLPNIARVAFNELEDDLKNASTDVAKLDKNFQILLNSLKEDVSSKVVTSVSKEAENTTQAMLIASHEIDNNINKNLELEESLNEQRKTMAKAAEQAAHLQKGISAAAMSFLGFSAILSNDTTTALEKVKQSLGTVITTSALFAGDEAVQAFADSWSNSIPQIDATEGRLNRLGARAGAIFTGIGTAIKTAILPMLAFQVAAMALSVIFTQIAKNFPSVKNLEDGVQNLNAELGSIKSKIQEIEALGADATDSDKAKLELYKQQLKYLEYQTAEAKKQLALSLLFGEGVWGKGLEGEKQSISMKRANLGYQPVNPSTVLMGGYTNPYAQKEAPTFKFKELSTEEKNKILDESIKELLDFENEINKKKLTVEMQMEVLEPESTEYEEAKKLKDFYETELTEAYKTVADSLGIYTAEQLKAKVDIEEFNDSIAKTVDSLTMLTEIESGLDSLNGVFNEFKENGAASASSIQGLQQTFIGSLGSFENFKNTLLSTDSTIDQVKAAMDKLVDEFIEQKIASGELAKENINLIGSQLELMGVTNASTAVYKSLQKQEALNTLSTRNLSAIDNASIEILRNRIKAINDTSKALNTLARIEGYRDTIKDKNASSTEKAIAKAMIYNLEKELTKAIEEEEVEFEYTPPVSGGAKETADKWKEAFENQLKDLKYSLDKGVIDAEQYYKALEKLNNKYFGKEKFGKYKEEFRQYELEVLKGLLDTYENAFKARFDNSIQWIEDRNKYSDWGADNEIAALQRVLDYTREAYAQGKILYKTYVEYKRELEDRFFEAQKQEFEKQRDLYEEQQDSVKDLLEATEELIKHEQEGQKKILEARKASLEALKDEQEFKDQMQKKTKALADLEFALKMAERDTTESGLAKQIELRQQIADAKEDITKDENDLAFELKQKELDDEIDAIEEYLDKTGKVTADAMERIEKDIKNGTTVLKEELIKWNRLYGTSIDSDITNMWESASTAFSRFSDTIRTSGLASVIAGIANEIKNLNEQLNKTSKPTQTQDFTKAQAVEMGQRARLNLTASGYTGPGIAELDLMDAKKAREWYGKYIPDHKGLTKEQKGYFLDIIKAKEAWAIAPYANGGISTNTHLALLHGSQSSPEWIFNNEQLKTVLASAVQSVRSNPIISLPKAAGIDSSAAVTSNVTFDFANMITVNGNADATTVQALKESSTEIVNMVINKINNQLKLNGQYVLTSK